MPWDPTCYKKFERERAAPFEDLTALIERRSGLRVVDLGCGSGELTARLAELLPDSRVLGVDSSPEMLAAAEPLAHDRLRFAQGDLASVVGRFDLIFSNAAIHWVEDHDKLLPRLYSLLDPGGQIVVQIPSNHDHFTHRYIAELALEPLFREALAGWTRTSPVIPIERYAQIFHDLGANDIVVFQKIYPHVLADADALGDWTSGTTLVPYMERLPAELRERFMERYRAGLRRMFTQAPVFYAFKRTLFSAKKP